MIEVPYLDFIRHTIKYTNAVIERNEQIVIVRGNQKCYLFDQCTMTLLKTALNVAASALEESPESFAVIDSA